MAGGGGPGDSALTIAILAENPLGYWKLDETSGSTADDYSGNGHDGTYSGPTLASEAGPDGGDYAVFDGNNDHVEIDDDDVWTIDTQPGLTVFACIKPTSTGSADFKWIIGKGEGASSYEWSFHQGQTGGQRLHTAVFNTAGAGRRQWRIGDQLTTSWQAVGCQIPNTDTTAEHEIYHNATSPEANTALAPFAGGSVGNTASKLLLGHLDGADGNGFDGGLAHLAVFAGVVDLADIMQAADDDGWY
jgi:hypothetical protein